MKHFDELELLDAYYDPSAAEEQLRHLETCAACRTRFERVTEALRLSAARLDAQVASRPESFWDRQRRGIERSIEEAPRVQLGSGRKFAVAASLVALLSGGLAYRSFVEHRAEPAVAPSGVAPVAEAPVVEAVEVSSDPWSSEELSGFHEVVQWEEWPAEQKQGGS
jgi:anti-sigma factor RsiW